MPELVIENGSGLSRRERISAASLAQVLQAAWASPVMPELVASLPLVGFDGTMKRRLALDSVAGQAHVKTGTLAEVRAVAGYVLAASGRYYVVVLLVNHPAAGGAQAGAGRAAAMGLRAGLRLPRLVRQLGIRPTGSEGRFPHGLGALLARLGAACR